MAYPHLTLSDLAANPGLVRDATAEDAARLLAEISALAVGLTARLSFRAEAHAASERQEQSRGLPDRWLTVQQVAERLGRDARWVYRRARRWPFTVKEGKSLLFSERGLQRHMNANSLELP